MKTKDIFYSKILLFGEYSIIKNSMALTMPYTHFTGELSFIADEKYTDCDFALSSNQGLKKFTAYLGTLQNDPGCLLRLDMDALKSDLKRGLYFESNIPQGYGIGSSGALCAAIYQRYAHDRIPGDHTASPAEIIRLKGIFSRLESYFHGTSSGIDPLNSYFGHPLLIRNKESIELVGIPRSKTDRQGAIFVINTGSIGHTEPLVRYFLEKYEVPSFKRLIDEDLIPLNNTCITALLEGDQEELFEHLPRLSRFQLDHFDRMIPANFRDMWDAGIQSGDYNMKLCGSGGGGFILGFTRDFDKIKPHFDSLGYEVITVYRSRQLLPKDF